MINYKDEAINYLVNKEEKYIDLVKEKLSKFENICIFPMGIAGIGIYDKLKHWGINANIFCDNNIEKIGQQYKGIPCISLDQLIKMKDNTIIIIETIYYKEIYNQLLNLGFINLERLLPSIFDIENYLERNDLNEIGNKVLELMDILEDEESKKVVCKIMESWFLNEYEYGFFDDIYLKNQYFIKEIIKLSEEEIFVDVGAFTGDTIETFIKNANYKFNKIIAFELNKNVYIELEKNIAKYEKEIRDKIVAYELGLSDEEKDVFYYDGDSGSSISDNGDFVGKVIDLDSVLNGDRVTYIKMDIEGAEFDALCGAKNYSDA